MRQLALISVSLCFLMSVAGCNSPVAHKAKIADMRDVCAARLQDLPLMPLASASTEHRKGEDGTVEFSDIARCVDVDGVKRPVAVFDLGAVPLTSRVDLKTILSPGGTFAGAVDVLDQSFVLLKHYGFDQFTRRDATYSISIFPQGFSGHAAYLVISPDDSKIGQSDQAVLPTTSGTPVFVASGAVYGAFYYQSGSELVAKRPYVNGGKLLVTVEPAIAPSVH
jgi:hypothetical protein